MGAKLGYYIGWEYDWDYDAKTNRTYKGIGLLRYRVPAFAVPLEKRHEYRERMNITIYLCDSPGDKKGEEVKSQPIVIRRIMGEYIVHIYDEEFTGGLEAWASVIETRWAGYYTAIANEQVGGLRPCECPQLDGKSYKIEVIEREYIPPITKEIPKREKELIEMIQERIKGISPDEAVELNKEIDKILKRYGR